MPSLPGDAHGGYVATTTGVALRILERVVEPDLIDGASFAAHAALDPYPSGRCRLLPP